MSKENSSLKKTQKLKDELLIMLVHDLKSLLSSLTENIKASYHEIDLILKQISDTTKQSGFFDFEEYRSSLKKQAHHLTSASSDAQLLWRRVINLLDVKKMEESQMHLEMSEFNINSLVDEAISDMEMMTHYHHVNVVATNLDKEIEVYSDYDLILRVLTNLLSNAIKHSGEEMEGKGEVKLTVKDEGKCLRFEILDSGNWNSESFIPTDTLRMRLYASPPYIFILILERYGTTFVKN